MGNSGKRICLIAGSAPTYRKEIFVRLGNELGCDYILGAGATRQMDKSVLPNKVMDVKTQLIKHTCFYSQKGASEYAKKYDILILNLGLFSITEWKILFLSKIRHQKTYCWTHGWYGKEDFLQRFIKRIYYSLFTGIFVYGDRARKLMIEEGYKKEKIVAIHNSLAYSEQLPLRKLQKPEKIYFEHFHNDNKNIVFIGRLTKIKRFDLLLDAVALLNKQGFPVNITFIGDGEERVKLEHIVEDYGISKFVWFYGACFDESVSAKLLFNADLCVSPGNIGLTAMHSLMFGCPAITNDDYSHQMPEYEAIKDGVTGAFFKAGDSQSLAYSIHKWFEEHSDDREIVRQECFKEIDNYWNPDFQMNAISEVINREG